MIYLLFIFILLYTLNSFEWYHVLGCFSICVRATTSVPARPWLELLTLTIEGKGCGTRNIKASSRGGGGGGCSETRQVMALARILLGSFECLNGLELLGWLHGGANETEAAEVSSKSRNPGLRRFGSSVFTGSAVRAYPTRLQIKKVKLPTRPLVSLTSKIENCLLTNVIFSCSEILLFFFPFSFFFYP